MSKIISTEELSSAIYDLPVGGPVVTICIYWNHPDECEDIYQPVHLHEDEDNNSEVDQLLEALNQADRIAHETGVDVVQRIVDHRGYAYVSLRRSSKGGFTQVLATAESLRMVGN